MTSRRLRNAAGNIIPRFPERPESRYQAVVVEHDKPIGSAECNRIRVFVMAKVF
jgi:hypothetical protein